MNLTIKANMNKDEVVEVLRLEIVIITFIHTWLNFLFHPLS